MAINSNNDKNIPIETEDCYETLASQEEIYLEETEEEVRAILISDDQSPPQQGLNIGGAKSKSENLIGSRDSMTDGNDDPRIAANREEQLDHAAENLITGDSDDPPLSEETVVEMIRMTHTRKTSRSVS